jgi:hypothetical protein
MDGADKIYVDCSGDEGFKTRKNRGNSSSTIYVAAGLFFPDPGPVVIRIGRLRRELEMKPSEEFKFSELSRPRRYAFLASLASFPLEVTAIVVPKGAITSPSMVNDGSIFRRYFCKLLLTKGIKRPKVFAMIDNGEGSEQQSTECWRYLMREVNKEVPYRLSGAKFVESHMYELVQAADMCAGAIRAKHLGHPEYARLIERGIINEWPFGPRT